jgi:hypothetical protein
MVGGLKGGSRAFGGGGSVSALRERAVIEVYYLRDLLAHADRADRVYYFEDEKSGETLVLASNVLWHGNLSEVDEAARREWARLKQLKGVRVKRIMDLYEVIDYLKSILPR